MAHDLQRFLDAQAPLYDQVLDELRAGHKRTHWMWFVFPQLRGLGRSATALHYGLDGLAEARAYAGHATLGARLAQCTDLLLGLQGRTAHQVFGSPDDLKLHSCMTLFERAAGDGVRYAQVLDRWYSGVRDPLTLDALAHGSQASTPAPTQGRP